MGLAVVDHRMHQVQCLADVRPTVDDVAEKDHLPARMTPDTALQAIAQLIQQPRQRMATAVDIADQVVATLGIQLHQSPPPRRLPQPSLVRQTS